MLDIGDRKQLFIDERFFAEREGLALQMGTPVQHLEPVLLPDRAWEEWGIGAYNTVWREADGQWRMWYDATMQDGVADGGSAAVGLRRIRGWVALGKTSTGPSGISRQPGQQYRRAIGRAAKYAGGDCVARRAGGSRGAIQVVDQVPADG